MIKNIYNILIFLGALVPVGVTAQNFSGHNWYFGNSNLALRFSRSDNSASVVTNQFTPFGPGGSAVANDPVTGNLIFYTDGTRVIDASHKLMPNGTLTGDNTRNQPVVVCQNPAKSSEYFIFHADATGTLRFSVYDSLLIGNATVFGQPPLGDIDPVRKNQTIAGLPAGLSEAMMMFADPNGDDFWLMAHTAAPTGGGQYHFVKISATGVTYEGSVSIGLIENAANFAFHPATNRISVSPKEADRDVELLTITFPAAAMPNITSSTRVINSAVSTATTQAIYDTEFSPDGRYLYVSVFGEGAAAGDVLQYDLTTPTLSALSVLPAPPPTESYGLQMGPDSTIYYLYQSGANFFLGGLSNTDSAAALVNYTPNAFPGNFGGRQFPSFAPRDSIKMKVFFEAQGTCANAPTTFFPTVTPGADSLRWEFGDGAASSDWSPVYTYQSGGPFDVKVTAYLNGQAKDTTQTINIIDFDTQITLVQDTTACSCELPFPKAANPPPPCSQFSVTAQIQGTGSATWQWYGPAGAIGTPSTGTSATLQPDSAGYYYLVATVGGCSTYAGVNIKEYGVQDQRANIWYFGQNAGIDFNPLFDTPPGVATPITNPVMNAPEGTSTISDRNGQVVFFTDGDKVWDRNFTQIAAGIGGEINSAQSALIIPVPGDETLYYIFTTQEIHGSYTYRLSYSLFDLKMNGGTGGMVETNVTLFTKSTERITGNGNWLIAHEYGNNTFRAYRITQLGISNPVFSSIGSDHSAATAENGQGYMKLGQQNRLAVALSTPGVSNVVEIFDFTDSTGTVSNFRSVNLNSTTGKVYGVEFGAGGNKLFATLLDATSKIYEFAFDSLGNPYQVKLPAPMSQQNYSEQLGAIQIGPDGQLYVAVNNKQYLGVIQVNADTARASNFVVNQFGLLPSTQSHLGLPNFIQIIADPLQGPGISITGLCLGDSTNFSATGTDPIDAFFWQITGPSTFTSTDQTFNHLFTTPGLYNALLRITNRCGLDTILRQQFRINDLPPDPSNVLSLCTPPQILDGNPTNAFNLTYLWETGDTTRTISVSQPGFYEITVTNSVTGCVRDGQIDLYPSLTTIDLGPDNTVCSAPGAGVTLNTNINIPQHVWTRNGATIPGNTGPTQVVDLSVAGTFTYIVTFTDPGNGCFVKDTVTYTVNQTPVVNLTPGPPIACNANNGQFSINISQPVGSPVSYTWAGPVSSDSQTNVAVPFLTNVTGLEAGTFQIQVNDQVTGCFMNDAATISTTAFTVNNTSATICGTAPISISTTPAQTGTYEIRDIATQAILESGNLTTSPQASVNSYAPGNYQVEVRNTGNCPGGAPITLSPGPQIAGATINTATLCTTSQATAVGTGAATFDWAGSTPGAIAGSTSVATVTVNPGTYTLQVIMDDGAGGACPTTVTQTVSVDPFVPNFTFDACTNPVVLVATPTGNVNPIGSYFYNWLLNGNPTPVGTGLQFSTTTSGTYTLSMQSPISGCPAVSSAPKVINILGPLSVVITTLNTPCEDAPFGLLATPSRTVSSYQWAFNGTDISGQTSAQLNNQTEAGNYAVTVSDGICSADADLDILLAPYTPGKLVDSRLICPDPANPDPNTRVAILDPGPNFAAYEWFEIINGSPSPLGITTQTYTAMQAGTFEVELENSFGCKSSDQTVIEVQCDPVVVGPNAFRPTSGLGSNQQFSLFTFFIDDDGFQIYIFNRWGEMIYESSDRQFTWNGGYKNNPSQMLPAGTYSYVVRYKSSYRPEDGTQEKRGGVLLMR